MFKGFNKYNFSKNSFQNFGQRDGLVANGDPLSVGTPIRWYDAMNIDASGIDWNTRVVSSWNDLMGNDNLVQSTVANKPIISVDGFSGKQAVKFSATDVMATSNSLGLTTTSHTLFIAVNKMAQAQIAFFVKTMLNRGINIYGTTTNPYGGSVVTYQEPLPTTPHATVLTLTAVLNTGLNIRVGSKLPTKVPYAFTGTDSDSKLSITGASDVEYIGEVILYDTALSVADCITVENYLKQKWNAYGV